MRVKWEELPKDDLPDFLAKELKDTDKVLVAHIADYTLIVSPDDQNPGTHMYSVVEGDDAERAMDEATGYDTMEEAKTAAINAVLPQDYDDLKSKVKISDDGMGILDDYMKMHHKDAEDVDSLLRALEDFQSDYNDYVSPAIEDMINHLNELE